MNKNEDFQQLAIFGNEPEFSAPIPVGQLYLPEWGEMLASFEGILDRNYYTNHGPLVSQLDDQFARYLGVKHAVSVTNGTVALMVALKALTLSGEVIVPSFTFPATVQAISWAGLIPVFCDVDMKTHNMSVAHAKKLITDKTTAILGVHLWGRACSPIELRELCNSYNLKLLFDASHAVGCKLGGEYLGNFGDIETFSFHATKVLSAAEGGCVTTNNDELASKIKTIRNFHVSESFGYVPQRINGKMSEAQAAMAILSLKNLPKNIGYNRLLYKKYLQLSSSWEYIKVVKLDELGESNYQYLVCEIDVEGLGFGNDLMCKILQEENIFARNYFSPGVHNMPPWNVAKENSTRSLHVTDVLSKSIFQLPIGSMVTENDVIRISNLISRIENNRQSILKEWSGSL